MDFEKELEVLINKHSKENESDTPDFILARFIKIIFSVLETNSVNYEKVKNLIESIFEEKIKSKKDCLKIC